MDVLVVDDRQINVTTLSRLLSHKGLQCATALSAGEALQLFKTNRIPLVISDIDMPGMNGVELALQIRARRSNTILFAFTGSSAGDLLETAHEVFDRVFSKPEDVTVLVETAATALQSLRVKA